MIPQVERKFGGVNVLIEHPTVMQTRVENVIMRMDRFFGPVDGVPDAKDKMRARNFKNQYSVADRNKAVLMAAKITSPAKAYRRGVAFKAEGIIAWPVFIIRCLSLLDVPLEEV